MANNDDVEIIRHSAGQKYTLVKYDGLYFFFDNTLDKPTPISTPGGTMLKTSYIDLADRIMTDLQKFGPMCMSAESILPWHYTMVENFARMEHSEVESMLDACFMQKNDWTYDCCQEEEWKNIFGRQTERVKDIREWLSKCTHMQMTAACCIGNAYHSINVAYVLASIMEKYIGKERKNQFRILADIIAENSFYGPASDMVNDFANFDLYYGIHLNEDGPIINDENISLENNSENDGFDITIEQLIGRNYYHYTDGEKDDEQPYVLSHDLSSMLSEEDEEDEEETDEDESEEDDDCYNELADNLPDDCWVKKLCVTEDDNVEYYLVALEVDKDKVVGTTILHDEVSRMGGGMFFIPGMSMPESHSYEEIEIDDCEAVKSEIKSLKRGRFIPKEYSFVGKKLPAEIIENDKYNGDDTEYMLCLQSAHRLAYMDLFISTDEDGVIEDFSDYTTYQSSGSSYGDMFSRPHGLDDKNEEAIDMLLYIIDKYTDEEYASL